MKNVFSATGVVYPFAARSMVWEIVLTELPVLNHPSLHSTLPSVVQSVKSVATGGMLVRSSSPYCGVLCAYTVGAMPNIVNKTNRLEKKNFFIICFNFG